MMLSPADVNAALPISGPGLILRRCERSDMSALAAWPTYPFPHNGFNFSFRGATEPETDSIYAQRMQDRARLMLVLDHVKQTCIGYFALLDMDWQAGEIGNLSVRMHPDWRGRGIGTRALRLLCDWAFDMGFRSLALDVAASNEAAVRCYLSVGFAVKRETWKTALHGGRRRVGRGDVHIASGARTCGARRAGTEVLHHGTATDLSGA